MPGGSIDHFTCFGSPKMVKMITFGCFWSQDLDKNSEGRKKRDLKLLFKVKNIALNRPNRLKQTSITIQDTFIQLFTQQFAYLSDIDLLLIEFQSINFAAIEISCLAGIFCWNQKIKTQWRQITKRFLGNHHGKAKAKQPAGKESWM